MNYFLNQAGELINSISSEFKKVLSLPFTFFRNHSSKEEFLEMLFLRIYLSYYSIIICSKFLEASFSFAKIVLNCLLAILFISCFVNFILKEEFKNSLLLFLILLLVRGVMAVVINKLIILFLSILSIVLVFGKLFDKVVEFFGRFVIDAVAKSKINSALVDMMEYRQFFSISIFLTWAVSLVCLNWVISIGLRKISLILISIYICCDWRYIIISLMPTPICITLLGLMARIPYKLQNKVIVNSSEAVKSAGTNTHPYETVERGILGDVPPFWCFLTKIDDDTLFRASSGYYDYYKRNDRGEKELTVAGNPKIKDVRDEHSKTKVAWKHVLYKTPTYGLWVKEYNEGVFTKNRITKMVCIQAIEQALCLMHLGRTMDEAKRTLISSYSYNVRDIGVLVNSARFAAFYKTISEGSFDLDGLLVNAMDIAELLKSRRFKRIWRRFDKDRIDLRRWKFLFKILLGEVCVAVPFNGLFSAYGYIYDRLPNLLQAKQIPEKVSKFLLSIKSTNFLKNSKNVHKIDFSPLNYFNLKPDYKSDANYVSALITRHLTDVPKDPKTMKMFTSYVKKNILPTIPIMDGYHDFHKWLAESNYTIAKKQEILENYKRFFDFDVYAMDVPETSEKPADDTGFVKNEWYGNKKGKFGAPRAIVNGNQRMKNIEGPIIKELEKFLHESPHVVSGKNGNELYKELNDNFGPINASYAVIVNGDVSSFENAMDPLFKAAVESPIIDKYLANKWLSKVINEPQMGEHLITKYTKPEFKMGKKGIISFVRSAIRSSGHQRTYCMNTFAMQVSIEFAMDKAYGEIFPFVVSGDDWCAALPPHADPHKMIKILKNIGLNIEVEIGPINSCGFCGATFPENKPDLRIAKDPIGMLVSIYSLPQMMSPLTMLDYIYNKSLCLLISYAGDPVLRPALSYIVTHWTTNKRKQEKFMLRDWWTSKIFEQYKDEVQNILNKKPATFEEASYLSGIDEFRLRQAAEANLKMAKSLYGKYIIPQDLTWRRKFRVESNFWMNHKSLDWISRFFHIGFKQMDISAMDYIKAGDDLRNLLLEIDKETKHPRAIFNEMQPYFENGEMVSKEKIVEIANQLGFDTKLNDMDAKLNNVLDYIREAQRRNDQSKFFYKELPLNA